MQKSKRLVIMHFVGFTILHLYSFYALYKIKWNIELALVFFFSYQIKILGITVGYHRYFTHKSFKTNIIVENILAILGTFAGQGPVIRWVGHHWIHHQHSDRITDPHSPVENTFLYSHIGWLLNSLNFDDSKFERFQNQFSQSVKFISNNFSLIFLAQIPLLFFLGGSEYILVGFVLSTTLCLHSTFLVNSLCHVIGSRPYETADNSRNNLFVALLTNGEGWHNNHHYKPGRAVHGVGKYQLDISYLVICFLEKIGFATNVRR